MTAIDLPRRTVALSELEAREGQPAYVTMALLRTDCPDCGQFLRNVGLAQWRRQGFVITLWRCTNTREECPMAVGSRYLRVTFDIVADAA